jgi:hypothetical protein
MSRSFSSRDRLALGLCSWLLISGVLLGLLAACQKGASETAGATPVAELSSVPTSVATPVSTPASIERELRDGIISLAHLQRLTEVVIWDDEPVALVHIYSEAPDYGWVDAAGEGLAAVDDAARAALVYLLYYERTGDVQALDLARACLNFVRHLQAEDGEYYNFVYDRDGTINTAGGTSYKSWGWWAARGQWALAAGFRVFRDVDPQYANVLQVAYLRGEAALRSAVGPVGSYNDLHGVAVPAWLIAGGSDVSALAVLGLAEYYETEPNSQTRQVMTNLATGVANFQVGGPGAYPFAAQPSATSSTALWHAWGSHQVHALARAGQLLGREDWIEAAERTTATFFDRLLATDFINEMAPIPNRRGQIAYGAQVITAGYWALHQATGDEQYARSAGLAASWLIGNNMAGVSMYDAGSGRVFDGIDGPTPFRINRNSGAESTIEGLYMLLLVADDALAGPYLRYRPVKTPPALVVEVEDGAKVAGDAVYGQREWTGEARFSNSHYYGLKAGDVVSVTLPIVSDGDYLVYASHLRRAVPQQERLAEAIRAPGAVVIDGALDEWAAAQALPVNSSEQIVRGAAAWPGAEQASFTLTWMWDDVNLYVAAQVLDPQHVQKDTGPSVSRGDALWLYFDTRGGRQRIDVKVTLAQTPEGPQVWSWLAQQFLPGAQLAWKQSEDGYIYEAALPLDSLNFLVAEEDKRIHFETGMGFTGGFIDWTGLDPDTAGNLAPLTLVTALSTTATAGDAPEQAADDVAFAVSLDGGEVVTVMQAVSPDRDYLWLDAVFSEPVFLSQGPHTLLISYAGRQPDREAAVDAFLIVPAVACKHLENDEGQLLVLCHDMQTATTTWEE